MVGPCVCSRACLTDSPQPASATKPCGCSDSDHNRLDHIKDVTLNMEMTKLVAMLYGEGSAHQAEFFDECGNSSA